MSPLYTENKPRTLNECFENLISRRGWYKQYGYSHKLAYQKKISFRKGFMTEKTIRDYLSQAGYQLYQQELWFKPNDNLKNKR